MQESREGKLGSGITSRVTENQSSNWGKERTLEFVAPKRQQARKKKKKKHAAQLGTGLASNKAVTKID